MEKTFDPREMEPRISAAWDEAGAFRAGAGAKPGADPYCIVIPPPNVTGSLHMGHALNNTLQDILCRFERMRGKDVLWQPGTDHAGIATQMVVERRLMERQQHRRSMGREAFLEKVWEWKAESGGTIGNQLRRMGFSCDFSRERFTMDEGLSQAVLEVFVALHKAGLIYKDKRLVNWDPKLLTAISDLEVMQVEVKGSLWYFDYPLADDPSVKITVATTRPETMLGDTAVAVHPDDERWKPYVGKMVRLPLVGRLIPIVADSYSDPEKGSGAVKITPAHDFNDFEVGRRHGLAMPAVLDREGRMALKDNGEFLEGTEPGADLLEVLALDGVDRFAARKSIVAMMEARELLQKIEPHTNMVPHGDRSNVVIEPYLTDQWYVDAKTLAKPAIDAVKRGHTVFVPKNWEKTYFEWMENIQPWCISRQLWWGHQIPAWYGPDGTVFVERTEDEAFRAAIAHYVEKGTLTEAEAAGIAMEGSDPFLVRDEDVLDTWFSSALWPFSTLGWPDETAELKRYYKTDVLVTGFDIIFFWVARMMMMGLHFMQEVPFHTVYIHALVRDEKGAKMSKSKGNVIDPLDLVDAYGADALRFTLAAMAAQGRDVKLARSRVEGYRNFATKLWNATRFAGANGATRDGHFYPDQVKLTLNRWIVGEAEKASREVTEAIEAYRFNDAANAAYRFVWNVVCDWYIELSKPVLQPAEGTTPDEEAMAETRRTLGFVLDDCAKLLHPFMPFVTEEIWRVTAPADGRGGLLAHAAWPRHHGLVDASAEAEIGFVVDLVTAVRSARQEMGIAAGAPLSVVLVAASAQTQERLGRWADMVKRLARIGEFTFTAEPPRGAVQLVVRGEVVALPLAGVVDLAAEEKRLAKEIDKANTDIAKVDAKLGNPAFVEKAPEEVIEENRERREEAVERKAKFEAALALVRSAA